MDVAAFIAYVRAHGDAVLSTLGPEGEPQAAFLSITATDLGELVFDAKDASRKIQNLRRDPRVAIVLGGADGTTMQVQGVADIPAGVDLDRCAAAYARAFPEFADSLVNPKVTVVRVAVAWARHGDYRSKPPQVSTVDLSSMTD